MPRSSSGRTRPEPSSVVEAKVRVLRIADADGTRTATLDEVPINHCISRRDDLLLPLHEACREIGKVLPREIQPQRRDLLLRVSL